MIEYLRTENRAPKETYDKSRILLSDDQRWRLVVRGKIRGRSDCKKYACLHHKGPRRNNFAFSPPALDHP